MKILVSENVDGGVWREAHAPGPPRLIRSKSLPTAVCSGQLGGSGGEKSSLLNVIRFHSLRQNSGSPLTCYQSQAEPAIIYRANCVQTIEFVKSISNGLAWDSCAWLGIAGWRSRGNPSGDRMSAR
jgi:hypothetical protein